MNEIHDAGVDLVNGFFCRMVVLQDNKEASYFVKAFTTSYMKPDEFENNLNYFLEKLASMKTTQDRVNGFWTLSFFVTHIFLIENEYFTKEFPDHLSKFHTFLSDFSIIAAKNKTLQMADSLSELILCLELKKSNESHIYSMANTLQNMILDTGEVKQEDHALGEREDLHSKLTSASALVHVLIFMDGKC